MASLPATKDCAQEEACRLIVQELVAIASPRLKALVGPQLWAMDAREMELWNRDLLRQFATAIVSTLLTLVAQHHQAASPPACSTCQRPMHLAERAAERTLLGLTGDAIPYQRAVYRCPDGHERAAPLDAILGIGTGHLMPALQEVACVAGLTDPFRDAERLLATMLGVQVPRSTLAPSVEAIGQVAEQQALSRVAEEATHEHMPPAPAAAGTCERARVTFVVVRRQRVGV